MFYFILGLIAGGVGMYFIIARFGKKAAGEPEAEKRNVIETMGKLVQMGKVGTQVKYQVK